jgi:hypothetical protein
MVVRPGRTGGMKLAGLLGSIGFSEASRISKIGCVGSAGLVGSPQVGAADVAEELLVFVMRLRRHTNAVPVSNFFRKCRSIGERDGVSTPRACVCAGACVCL